MSNWEQYQAERQALQALNKLFEDAEECVRLYERAHMSTPEPLKRFLGLDHGQAVGQEKNRPGSQIPPMERSRPSGVPPDWICVRTKECTPTTLIPALLNSTSEPLAAREIIDQLTSLNPALVQGSIYNAGTRLQNNGIIDRQRTQWILIKPEMAGRIDGSFLWADLKMLQKQEIASHRRDAILHVLSYFQAGLQIVQLVEQLQKLGWVRGPINKDAVKIDMKELSRDGKVRHRGNSAKWELNPEGANGPTLFAEQG